MEIKVQYEKIQKYKDIAGEFGKLVCVDTKLR